MALTHFYICITILPLIFHLPVEAVPMECKYGPRGSLTVFCTNATADYFKLSRYRYDHLDETLKCINCTLTTIESGTFDLSLNQIKTVDIRNSKVQVIKPKAFIGLIFMERLLLSYNPISEILPGAFIGIKKVKYIELEHAVSLLIPHVFEELHSLQVLILRNNNLDKLEAGTFVGLNNLKILDLSNNRLESIGTSLDPLVNLVSLNLKTNNLKTISGNEFYNLKHIAVINLEHNYLSSFVINMEPQCTLRILNLSSNVLKASSVRMQTFQNLSNLEELDLSFNLFNEIPIKFFQGLYRLRIINFFGNNLKSFTTGSFSGLPHLRTLNLSHNHLESVKVSGRLILPSLHTLDLSDNEIKYIDYVSLIARVPKISHINLLNNNLPCEVTREMVVLFESDGIHFVISSSSNQPQTCPNKTKTDYEILQDLSSEFRKEHGKKTIMVWMFVLLTIFFVLLGVLFYIQFFYLGINFHQNEALFTI